MQSCRVARSYRNRHRHRWVQSTENMWAGKWEDPSRRLHFVCKFMGMSKVFTFKAAYRFQSVAQ